MFVSQIILYTFFIRPLVLGWAIDQVNTSMCFWQNPRAAVVRDAVYIDGGSLWWRPGLSDGTYGPYVSDGNPLGLVYILNFSTPFDTSQNISSIFTTSSKASGGGAANNIGPNYEDGGMLANDYQWVTYGGLLTLTDSYPPPGEASFATDRLYPSNQGERFEPGYVLGQLPADTTRYVTYGAAVDVKSENLGFYFSGLRSASHGPIYLSPGPANESLNADQLSPTLIELDMDPLHLESWKNHTLPDEAPSRASAEIVWVPASEKGVLIAIGGVVYPAYANINQKNNASTNAASQEISPTFMSTVSVYDVASGTWYKQNATGAPAALAQGCTVVASAQDGSSHNIYWYGGFDGVDLSGDFSDDVWVLSVPSFTWTRLYNGTASHARAGHRCVKPYPDQMFVIGGYASESGDQPSCLEGGVIQVFNLSSGTWINSYDPSQWSNYSVPLKVRNNIGGTATGGASRSMPPGGYNNESMATLFGARYNSSKFTTWYPYAATQTSDPDSITEPSVVHKRHTPKYLAPMLAGLAVLIITAIAFIWRAKTLQQLTRVLEILRSDGHNIAKPLGTEKAIEIDGDKPVYEASGDTRVYELPNTAVVDWAVVCELPCNSFPPPLYGSPNIPHTHGAGGDKELC